MLHVLRSASPPYGPRALRAMFEARKQVFVDLLGWDVPVIDGRYEVDQFDDEHCIYLILTDPAENHLGSARLLPTTRAHILHSLYPALCDDAPPQSPAWFEITRFCLARELPAARRRRVRDTLVAVLADFALTRGITGYCAVAEPAWARQIDRFGWRTQALGPEQQMGATTLCARSILINADTPGALRAAGIKPDASLFQSCIAA